jgi:hypothetical protein
MLERACSLFLSLVPGVFITAAMIGKKVGNKQVGYIVLGKILPACLYI